MKVDGTLFVTYLFPSLRICVVIVVTALEYGLIFCIYFSLVLGEIAYINLIVNILYFVIILFGKFSRSLLANAVLEVESNCFNIHYQSTINNIYKIDKQQTTAIKNCYRFFPEAKLFVLRLSEVGLALMLLQTGI